MNGNLFQVANCITELRGGNYMLLYSTLLKIKDTLTKEAFIDLIIEWNQNNPHEENVIKGIAWNGGKNSRFGDERLWLEIIEYTNKNIVAVRYEKVTDDGVTWDTDYILNFDEMKMSIQLDRSYREDVLVTNAIFSTPLFISFLIDHDYLQEDGELKVGKRPIEITGDNLDLFAAAISGRTHSQLPIVFVSKTATNKEPVDVSLLASKLKGAAHVMVQENRETNKDIRIICNEENDYNGAIGIYYPNKTLGHRRCKYREVPGIEKNLLDRVVSYVFQYGNLQKINTLYTWQGVNNAILNARLSRQMEERQKAEKAMAEAQNEVSDVYAELDEELQDLQKKVKDLTKINEALMSENQGLMAKLSKNEKTPVLYMGEEEDLYHGEIKDFILSSLSEVSSKSGKATRKKDVLDDIVASNNYQHLAENKKQQLKQTLKGYKSLNSAIKQELIDLGFEFMDDKNHYKLIYNGDTRYQIILAKTPSDNRTGDNTIGTISKKVF